MNRLMDWHFDVQKGMYFDRRLQLDGCDILLSDIIEDGFWNYAFIPPEVDLADRLTAIEQAFQTADRKPCIYIADGHQRLATMQLLEGKGYSPLSEESFMTYAETRSIPIGPRPSTPKPVVNEGTRKDFVEVFTAAYGGEKTPEQPYGEIDKSYVDALVRSFSDQRKFTHFVCYEGTTPVSIASLCFVDGKGGLYNVGTSPAHRGKGHGTVATGACVDAWAQMGGDVLFLQTETGSSVEKWYNRLGFRLAFVGSIYCRE